MPSLEEAQLIELAGLLVDCEAGGTPVSFMRPLARDQAVAFWCRVARGVREGHRAVLTTKDNQGNCGTDQLILDQPENQPHRAELAKLLAHRRVRRQGLGAALMLAAEDMASEHNKTLFFVETVTNSDADRLYERLRWVRASDNPGSALYPDGGLSSTIYYYRTLT